MIYGTPPLRWKMLNPLMRQGLLFGLSATTYAKLHKADLVFARDYSSAAFCAMLGLPTVMETHAAVGFSQRWFNMAARACKRPAFKAVITISPVLQEYYATGAGMPAEKIHVLPTGVNLEAFERPATQPWLSPVQGKRPTITYAGHLYDYKGIPAILEAAALAPDLDFNLVGGLPEDVSRCEKVIARRSIANVTLYGNRMQSEVPAYLWRSNVLLLPPSAHHPSARWTSPVKLGEYLASGTPIVATDIPALRHWLSDREAAFVPPDDGIALLAGIRGILADSTKAAERIASGLALARKWSYAERARSILKLAGF
jgi:glycosyltransferase involved in cell wall biosynthesis